SVVVGPTACACACGCATTNPPTVHHWILIAATMMLWMEFTLQSRTGVCLPWSIARAVGCPGSMHDARVMAESELADAVHGNLGQLLWSARQETQHMPVTLLCCLPSGTPLQLGALTPPVSMLGHGPARRKVECTFGRLKARWRVLLRENDLTLPYVPTVIMACFILHNIVEQRAEPVPEEDERYMAMLAAYNAMFEGIELLGVDEDGMGDNGGAAAAGGMLVPFVRDAVVQRLRQT
ncbi:DDE Tnp4 domain-containing protein, partial [Haematococcus lacustris]